MWVLTELSGDAKYSSKNSTRKYVIIYYDNGQKQIEGSYLYNKKNGLFMMYYKNGVKSFRGEYLDGSGVGFWSYFDKNGQIIKKIDCSTDNCN